MTNPQSPFYEWSVQNVCLESKGEWEEGHRIPHYIEKLTKLIACIGPGICKIGIEHYIMPKPKKFGSGVTGGFLTLVELGGILRSLLWLKGHHDFIEMSATAIKLFFSGNGRADKQGMYTAYKTSWLFPDLYASHGLKGEESYKHVPHPLEDEIDALAIALFTLCYD